MAMACSNLHKGIDWWLAVCKWLSNTPPNKEKERCSQKLRKMHCISFKLGPPCINRERHKTELGVIGLELHCTAALSSAKLDE